MSKTKCLRCKGTGRIYEYAHIQSGICFKCNGSGIVNAKSVNKNCRQERQQQQQAAITEFNRRISALESKYFNDSRIKKEFWNNPMYKNTTIKNLATIDGLWDSI